MVKVRIGVLGASGYTGAELLRLLHNHPEAEIAFLTAERQAGRAVRDVYPHLATFDLPDLKHVDDVSWSDADVIFCGLPHGTTQDIIRRVFDEAPDSKVVDLSADFRLRDAATYAEWYGHEHRAMALQQEAVYGLTEVYRADVAKARLVANPGCYTTASELPLIPLLKTRLIEAKGIVIDAKSGVSGAGRSEKLGSLHTEVSEGIHAYSIAKHRHSVEIDQELSVAAGHEVVSTFTPHLMPMNRGILSTIYVALSQGKTVADLRTCLEKAYASEPFVHVMPEGVAPSTRDVRGTNQCRIGIFADRAPGRAILISAIDNLVKGASGQAIQNMNVMLGLPETAGLDLVAMFP